MRKKFIFWVLLSFCFPFISEGQSLVADINRSEQGGRPLMLTSGSNHVVFTAEHEIYGRELFVSDSTHFTAHLIKDLSPGNASTIFIEVAIIDTNCYFITYHDAGILQLWVTSLIHTNPVLLNTSSAAGFSKSGGSQVGQFTRLGDEVYFIFHSLGLWKTDGTPEGTQLIKNFDFNVSPSCLGVYNNQLIFLAENSLGVSQLWKSDGTDTGTHIIKSIDTQFGIQAYVQFKDKLYFAADNGTSGLELWQSDGTAAGTHLFVDLAPGNASSSPSFLTAVGENLFFAASTDNNYKLWRTQGTPESTQLVKDIRPGLAYTPLSFQGFKNTLFFLADDGIHGIELWKSDGSAEGTKLVKDIFIGPKNAYDYLVFKTTTTDDFLFFVARDSLQGKGCWRTDGTEEGTIRLHDLAAWPNYADYGVAINDMVSFQNAAYFVDLHEFSGLELWKTDGTIKGTGIFTKIKNKSAGSFPGNLLALNDQFLFSARTHPDGFELWKSDGTANGTQLVKDINPGAEDANPQFFTRCKDHVYFSVQDSLVFQHIWKSDGTAKGTVELKDYLGRKLSSFNTMAVVNDKLLINATHVEKNELLWVSDGTAEGTKVLKEPYPANSRLHNYPGSIQDTVFYFTATDASEQPQLWKTDGTPLGTHSVTSNKPIKSVGRVLAKINNNVFFTAVSQSFGEELWVSNGTSFGTRLLKDINPGPEHSGIQNEIIVNNNLYFTATDGVNGHELWKSDGTAQGTIQVKDIVPGSFSSYPYQLTAHKNELFFLVDRDTTGTHALWKSNGTPEGTQQVKIIANSGDSGNFIRHLFSWGAYLYFSASDGLHGRELWRSNGTDTGTVMLIDLYPGSASSDPENFLVFHTHLYFSANDGQHGNELWQLVPGNVVSVKETLAAQVLLFPNPATDQLIVRQINDYKTLHIRLFDAAGKLVIPEVVTHNSDAPLQVSQLSSGLYLLEIREKGTKKRRIQKIFIVH
ncbi:ELWxxDGT repeat protein [Haliscomenobacter sp.]|uniref:ELWxxDGT repeat protein n=1 Tax=Haliscomenobacter sp. TaxID=2717303 RepID=UPI003BACE35B